MNAETAMKDADAKSVGTLAHQDDVVQFNCARAGGKHEHLPKFSDSGAVPPKKRKTRRGKCKRRYVHPYVKKGMKSNKVVKPEAPYNSNRFLIEDHGSGDDIVERLKNNDQISTSTVTRTRDSSFSVDSDGEFYSTPDDEEEFLIKDFADQYESLQTERLHAMTKTELIQEYLILETQVESLTKSLMTKGSTIDSDDKSGDDEIDGDGPPQSFEFQKEIERLTIENENLKLENETLKSKLSRSCSSDSADSETDSSDSCSTTTTSSMSKSSSPVVEYPHANGRSPTPAMKETV